ncbi:hypothetical protein OpiT1DRAFT_05419 [Opitutaceae bacterium TAV1]|nr:hypothetical protein OpiT1DRAFT_05419 [Opitutaceae bacterium TAV1]
MKHLFLFALIVTAAIGQQKIEIVGTGTLPPGVHNRVVLVSISEDAARVQRRNTASQSSRQ